MLLVLLLAVAHGEMCAYLKQYSGPTCTTLHTEPIYGATHTLTSTCMRKSYSTHSWYGKATCDADGTNIHFQYECDNDDCSDCYVDESEERATPENISFDCGELRSSSGGIFVKWVCEDCSTLRCDLNLLDGTKANTDCYPTTGEPIDGNHCLTQAYYTDNACTERYVPKYSSNYDRGVKSVYDSTCREEDVNNQGVLYRYAKGICTMDADGNMVTGRLWNECDGNTCAGDADTSGCPDGGVDKFEQSFCEHSGISYTNNAGDIPRPLYTKYACEKCDEIDCPATFIDGNSTSGCTGEDSSESGSAAHLAFFALVFAMLMV